LPFCFIDFHVDYFLSKESKIFCFVLFLGLTLPFFILRFLILILNSLMIASLSEEFFCTFFSFSFIVVSIISSSPLCLFFFLHLYIRSFYYFFLSLLMLFQSVLHLL